jgi:hypothetical protein
MIASANAKPTPVIPPFRMFGLMPLPFHPEDVCRGYILQQGNPAFVIVLSRKRKLSLGNKEPIEITRPNG